MSRKWSHTETMLLLTLYLKYKQDFQERRKKRAEIWQHIIKEFEQEGFKANYIMLDRKIRNMTRTYFNIKRQNKSSDRNWEYFSTMQEIFADTAIPETVESLEEYEDDSQQSVQIKTEDAQDEYPEILMDEANFNQLMSSCTNEEPGGLTANLAGELETERIQELRAIRITLEEANSIQRERNGLLQERNELMKQYLAVKFKYNQHLYD